jgi:hypothetical protein
MREFPSPAARLGPLLDWLNGRPVSAADARGRVLRFVAAFDGDRESGYVTIYTSRREPWAPPERDRRKAMWIRSLPDDDAVEALRVRLVDVLRRGFPLDPRYPAPVGPWVEDLASLRFGTYLAGERTRPGTRARLGPTDRGARQAYRAPGAHVLLVDGALPDLATFLAMHLLTTAPGILISRCPAPAPHHWDQYCGHFVLTTGRGRPREFCTGACRIRHHALEVFRREQQERQQRRRKTHKEKRR